MKILGIETSCDETAAAVVEDGYKMLSNVVSSSVDLHATYGGVVPEIAARSHLEVILPVINQALQDAIVGNSKQGVGGDKTHSTSYLLPPTKFDPWDQIDAIAVTTRPGLIGSLLIGVLTARTLAIAKNKPLYGVNHVLAHTYANFITEVGENAEWRMQNGEKNLHSSFVIPHSPPRFPFLALIVSGGHTQLMLYRSHTDYTILGQTKDDAVGEAFDKVAKILGLPYPGGPSIDKAAQKGDPTSVKLPKAKLENSYDFSFSGLKTAVLRAAQAMAGKDFTFPSVELPAILEDNQKANLAASFQATVIETLSEAVTAAEAEFKPKNVILAGGVAANLSLRQHLEKKIKSPLLYPDIKLCTDNASMIASAACYWQQPADNPYKLVVIPSL